MAEGQARAGAWRAARTGIGLLASGAALFGLAGAANADPCDPWPGEPSPLPRLSDSDGMLGRWAQLRVQELSLAASSLEETSPMRAQQLWRRVLCFDPGDEAARDGIARTPSVALHSPAIVVGPKRPTTSDAFASLSETLHVRLPRPEPPPPAPRPRAAQPPAPTGPDTKAFDASLAELESLVRAAKFEEALETAGRGRAAARELGAEADEEQTARLEVLAATAALALGQAEAADASFERALDADPGLRLDPASTSPKVRRALEKVRRGRSQ